MLIRNIPIRSIAEMGELLPLIADQADFLDWTSRDVQLLERVMTSARKTSAKNEGGAKQKDAVASEVSPNAPQAEVSWVQEAFEFRMAHASSVDVVACWRSRLTAALELLSAAASCPEHVAGTQCERMADVHFVCGKHPCIINGHKCKK